MALDPSIYAQFLRPPKSMDDYDREALDLESARQGQQSNALQLMMGRQKVDEYQRGVNESNALRELQRSLAGKPEADVVSGYRAAGRFGEAAKLESDMLDRQKKQLDIAKDAATTAKTYGEAQAEALKRYRGALDFIDTPQGVARWLQAQYADPLLAQHMQALGPLDQALQRLPQDPAGLQQWRQQAAMGMEKYMERQRLQMAQAETARHNAQSEADTRRGQDMADRRAREATAASMSKPFEVTGPDGLPLLVQQDKRGNITPVEGFGPKSGSSKPLNDTQAKALLFGTRMQEADKVLADTAARGTDMPSVTKRVAESVPLIGGALGAAANATVVSGDQQSVEQAQRDFINAVLRRESGAAIAESEFANARKQYFPEVGDSDQVKRQKAANRQLAINGLLAEVPEGRRTSITPNAPPQPVANRPATGASLTRVPLTSARAPAKPVPAGIKFLGFE